MRKIHLHGALAAHGKTFDLDVQTAGEAIVALCTIKPEIMEDIRLGTWVLMRGDPETGLCLDEEMVVGLRLGDSDLHILPEVMGAKNNGLIKAMVGVALITVSFGSAAFLAAPISTSLFGAGFTWGNAIGQLGLAMTLSGVSTMLAPETPMGTEDDASFVMSGPTSQSGQGAAVQIAYGEVITGGMVISGGVDISDKEIVWEEPATSVDATTEEETA